MKSKFFKNDPVQQCIYNAIQKNPKVEEFARTYFWQLNDDYAGRAAKEIAQGVREYTRLEAENKRIPTEVVICYTWYQSICNGQYQEDRWEAPKIKYHSIEVSEMANLNVNAG